MRKMISLLAVALIMMSFSPDKPFSEDWSLYTSKDGVEIYFQLSDCNDPQNGLFQKRVLLKVVNTNAHDVQAQFAYQKWYDNKASFGENGIDDEQWKTLTIPATSFVGGECSEKDLSVFHSFENKENVPVLTRLELVEFNVKVQ